MVLGFLKILYRISKFFLRSARIKFLNENIWHLKRIFQVFLNITKIFEIYFTVQMFNYCESANHNDNTFSTYKLVIHLSPSLEIFRNLIVIKCHLCVNLSCLQ